MTHSEFQSLGAAQRAYDAGATVYVVLTTAGRYGLWTTRGAADDAARRVGGEVAAVNPYIIT